MRSAWVALLLFAWLPSSRASAEVMGFVPYWDRGVDEMPWEVLDGIVYFGASVTADGSIAGTSGWPDEPDVTALIERAQAEDVEILLTVTNFDAVSIGQLVGSAEARQALIDEIVSLVLDAGGSGVNIDFEFVDTADSEAFLLFLSELSAAFHTADPGSRVTVAAPAVDWWGSYDAAELLEVTDGIFVMAYNYHYAGGSPGPVAPLSAGEIWNEDLTLVATIDYYLEDLATQEERARVVLGLPLYGYDWPAESDVLGAAATDRGSAVFFGEFKLAAAEADPLWDEPSATPWYAYESEEDGSWHQVWCEDVTSIDAKVDLAVEHGMGVGFWALGYDDGDDQLWSAVADSVGLEEPSPDAGMTSSPDAGTGEPVEPPPASGGCAAAGSRAPAGGAILALLWLALLPRRRRL